MCPLCNQPVPVNRGEDPNNKVISGLIYGLLLALFPGPPQLPSLAVLQATASDGSWAGPGNEASLLSCLILVFRLVVHKLIHAHEYLLFFMQCGYRSLNLLLACLRDAKLCATWNP